MSTHMDRLCCAAAIGVILWTGVSLGRAAERTVLLEHFTTVG